MVYYFNCKNIEFYYQINNYFGEKTRTNVTFVIVERPYRCFRTIFWTNDQIYNINKLDQVMLSPIITTAAACECIQFSMRT